ncbi:MAG: hypothetical protein Q4F00_13225 [bacterium]|nr:hypothetical protein [bacterium]
MKKKYIVLVLLLIAVIGLAVFYYPVIKTKIEVNNYRKWAVQGDAYAQKNLGDCYIQGKGVEKDQQQAVYWYRKAAEQGHADA